MKSHMLLCLAFIVFLFAGISLQAQPTPGKSATGETMTISDSLQQKMRFGIDNIVLYWWYPSMEDTLAELGVQEVEADFVRVAISCAYELTEGEKNPEAYDEILNMMHAIRRANPDINFFGSPLPLWHAYGDRDAAPWTPYPMWVQEWENTGTEEDPDWEKGDFHVDKLVQYLADYLNFMDNKGFEITWLDLTNEQQILQPHHTKIVHDSLPQYLNEGIEMPKLIVPSSWSHDVTIEWLQAVDKQKNEHEAFSVASTHNTGGNYLGEALVNQAKRVEAKEIWSTELHEWGGEESAIEIKNSSVLWRHIRDGFNGIVTWLFYGNYAGRFHPMLWAHPNKGIRKSTKYEIFKKLVNNANRGYYVHTPSIHSEVYTAAFVKGNFLNVWVLNNSDASFDSLSFDLESFRTKAHVAKEIKWTASTPRSGLKDVFIPGNTSITRAVAPHSLYSFKVKLTEPPGGGYENQPSDTLSDLTLHDAIAIKANGFVDDTYQGSLPVLADSVLQGWKDRDLQVTQAPEPGTIVEGTGNEVMLRVSNQEGDTSRVHFLVNVLEDNEKPTVTCISDTTVYVDPSDEYTVAGDEFDPADTSDNTCIIELTNNITGSPTLEGATFSPGTTTILWIAEDIAGNQGYCRFDVTVEEEATGTREIGESKISVYPNPAGQRVHFHSKDQPVRSVSLTDLTGKVLFRKENVQSSGSMDLSGLESGIYLLKVTTEGQIHTTKILKR